DGCLPDCTRPTLDHRTVRPAAAKPRRHVRVMPGRARPGCVANRRACGALPERCLPAHGRCGLAGGLDLVDSPGQTIDRTVDVGPFIQAEQADAEGLEISRLPALQRYTGCRLHTCSGKFLR